MTIHNKNFEITWNPDFQDDIYGVTPQLKAQFDSLHEQSNDKNNKIIIDELIGLTIKYPHAPMLKNYLANAYFVKDDTEKAREVNDWILAEHPNYMYAIIKKVQQHIAKENFDEAEQMLHPDLHLQSLYPNRKLFHATEVISYYATTIQFLCATDDVDRAIERWDLIKDIDPTSEALAFAGSLISNKIGENPEDDQFSWIKDEMDNALRPDVTKYLDEHPYRIPKFYHREMLLLYRYEMDIAPEILETILALPRETLIHDCVTILDDAEYNFVFYINKDAEYAENCFLAHAMYILSSKKATETLPQMLSIFENNMEFLDHYFGDDLQECVWQVFYQLGKNQPKLLVDFLLKPNIETNAKILILNSLEQICVHNKITKNELYTFYDQILDKCLETKDAINFIDSDFIAFLITDTLQFKFVDLLPKIKILYKKELVSLYISGDYKEVRKSFAKNNKKIGKQYNSKILDIFEIYKNCVFDDFNDDQEIEPIYQMAQNKPEANFPKVGRNDSCPCGSGQKFKKCCG